MVEVCVLGIRPSRWTADGRSAAQNLKVAVEEIVMLACKMGDCDTCSIRKQPNKSFSDAES